MLKRPETILVWRHWFGRSLRPGKPSNSPRGAEGATTAMARRARVPFPPSSIPAYIEQSMKLFVCLQNKNPALFFCIFFLHILHNYVAYICINMQNNMQTPKSICRIVQGSYFAFW